MNIECTKCGLLMSTLESNPVACLDGSKHSFPTKNKEMNHKCQNTINEFGCPMCSATECCYECCKEEYQRLVAPSTCPLTNSSHEKALVRVVEREDGMYTKDVIQVLCSCGHIISEAEIKSK